MNTICPESQLRPAKFDCESRSNLRWNSRSLYSLFVLVFQRTGSCLWACWISSRQKRTCTAFLSPTESLKSALYYEALMETVKVSSSLFSIHSSFMCLLVSEWQTSTCSRLRCILYSEQLKNSDLLQKKTKSEQTNRKAAFNLECRSRSAFIYTFNFTASVYSNTRTSTRRSAETLCDGFLIANMAESILEGVGWSLSAAGCRYHLTNPSTVQAGIIYTDSNRCVH